MVLMRTFSQLHRKLHIYGFPFLAKALPSMIKVYRKHNKYTYVDMRRLLWMKLDKTLFITSLIHIADLHISRLSNAVKLILQFWYLEHFLWNGLRWALQSPIDDKSTLVQVMAWCHQATSHYMSQCWPISMLPYGIKAGSLLRNDWVADKHEADVIALTNFTGSMHDILTHIKETEMEQYIVHRTGHDCV